MTAKTEKNGNREQEISNISRSLKSLAKELNIPVLALSQLSRSVESRPGSKKPILSDLRESGATEQDADMVIFIYRPEYYGLSEDEDHSSTKGKAVINIAKHRNGKLGDVELRFVGQYARFEDLEQDYSKSFGNENAGGNNDQPAQFAPNANFNAPNERRVGSRMNNELGDVPF